MEEKETKIGIEHIHQKDKRKIRLLIAAGICTMIYFFNWLFSDEVRGNIYLYTFILIAFSFKGLKILQEWYYYWNPTVYPKQKLKKHFTVDVLTTFCKGEPIEMVKETLSEMIKIRYPHTNYLCDESNNKELQEFCNENNINYVTRIDKKNAKAGNINNALKQAKGDICLILDPDHIPELYFLDRVLPYFQDEQVGFVQCVQSYYNQQESIVAKAAAEQSYHFYGPMMMSMNTYGSVQAIGANCTFRRKALDSIGGHAAGLAEDMHTAMLLLAEKWKGIYVPEALSRGLVPSSLKAYFGQQLKWSKGVFELLIHVYPKLFHKFSSRQKIHFLFSGLYFLFGWIILIDFLIPPISLFSEESALYSNLTELTKHLAPFLLITLTIRINSQNWLIEENEKGFHLAGGILYVGTWWIYLKGTFFALTNKHVAYHPTIKKNDNTKYWNYLFPNVFILLISCFSIFYAFQQDINEYSILMAVFAGINIMTLTSLVMFEPSTKLIYNEAKNKIYKLNIVLRKCNQLVYRSFKNGYVPFILLISFLFMSEMKKDIKESEYPLETSNFYIGVSKIKNSLIQNNYLSKNINPDIIHIPFSFSDFFHPEEILSASRQCGNAIPYLELIYDKSWNPEICIEKLKMISQGYLDQTFRNFCNLISENNKPVFISYFLPPNLNSNSKENYLLSIRQLHNTFQKYGVNNVVWIWNYENEKSNLFYPGENYVDWIITEENIMDSRSQKYKFDYQNIRPVLLDKRKNIILKIKIQNNIIQNKLGNIIEEIKSSFPEIKALLFPEINSLPLSYLIQQFSHHPILNNVSEIKSTNQNLSDISHFKKSNWKIYEKNFYIKGIAYNTGHDWRDGEIILTRKKIRNDFNKIKEMGGNCIRRYRCDKNEKKIFDLASEAGLYVLPGFWFDPKIDYYTNTEKVNDYINSTMENVKLFKNHASIIGWCLGNETWGLLKKHFAKPYLFYVRNAYVEMIEKIAREIHKIDPNHPVITCIEHDEAQLPSELNTYKNKAPSIDVIGINSYYKNQISILDSVFTSILPDQSYLISEFGPNGYWNEHYNKYENQSIHEETEFEKANWYKKQWQDYILSTKTRNIGGFAYCWSDRMEGSLTWFGLTDITGRKKASWFALKEAWTGKKESEVLYCEIKTNDLITKGNTCLFKGVLNSTKKLRIECIEWKLFKNEYMERIKTVQTDLPEVELY